MAIAERRPIYGLTGGVGDLYTVKLKAEDIARAQLNMLRSPASGMGAPLDELSVRAIMATMIIFGEGRAFYKGKLLSGQEAMRRASIDVLVLGPREATLSSAALTKARASVHLHSITPPNC